MTSPFLSVILPTHNRKHCISRMIDSVLMQSFEDFELIIIDDGSTDGSVEFLQEHYEDKRIRVARKENGGVSSARNLGISMALGKYITFVDSDDYLLEGFFEDIYQTLKLNKKCVDLLIFPNYIKDKHRIYTSSIFFSENARCFYTKESIKKIQSSIFIKDFCMFFGNPNVCSKVFHRDIIKEISFQEEIQFGEDLLFLILSILKTNLVYLQINRGYYVYDICHTSLSRGELRIEKQILDLLKGFYFFHDNHIQCPLDFIAFNYINHLRFYIVQAKREFLRSQDKKLNYIFKIAQSIQFPTSIKKTEFFLLYMGLQIPLILRILNCCYNNISFFTSFRIFVKNLRILEKKNMKQNKTKKYRGGGS